MTKVLCLRLASAAALLALAVLMLGINSLLSFDPGARATVVQPSPISVNRALKSDRLFVPDWKGEFAAFGLQPQPSAPRAQQSAPRAQSPFGCDPAFSPIFTSGSKNVYGRCMA
jgi:hypothetical protein